MIPNVFKTTAIKIRHTIHTDKWNRAIEKDIDLPFDEKLAGNTLTKQLAFVNKWVNRHVVYRREVLDLWSPAWETLEKRFGDCEDFAILKYAILRKLGVPREYMFLTMGKDLGLNGQIHAVLVVWNTNAYYVLDNVTDKVYLSTQNTEFKPMVSINEICGWIHS